MATLKSSTFTSLVLPTGPTANRPGSPTAGMMRHNTTMNLLEFYDGGTWRPITGISKGSLGTGGNSISYVGNSSNRTSGGIVHAFTTAGTATFTPAFTGTVEVLVVAGGGSGGAHWGGGGGGGGVIYNRAFPVTSGTGYSVTVGAGGTAPSYPQPGNQGGNSVFSTITSTGGGGGGSWDGQNGQAGGSGGGGQTTSSPDSRFRTVGFAGIAGQGFPGGSGVRYNQQTDNCHHGGGGGGAGGPGMSAPDNAYDGRTQNGGPGTANDIFGSVLYWGGGGGGTSYHGVSVGQAGGIGGGGGGTVYHGQPRGPSGQFNGVGGGQALNDGQASQGTSNAGNAGANTGGGGGGANYNNTGTSLGGSGIVIVRY